MTHNDKTLRMYQVYPHMNIYGYVNYWNLNNKFVLIMRVAGILRCWCSNLSSTTSPYYTLV